MFEQIPVLGEDFEQRPLLPYHIAAPQVNFHWGRCFQHIKIAKVLSGLMLISGGVYIGFNNRSNTLSLAVVVPLIMIIVGSRIFFNAFLNAIEHRDAGE